MVAAHRCFMLQLCTTLADALPATSGLERCTIVMLPDADWMAVKSAVDIIYTGGCSLEGTDEREV